VYQKSQLDNGLRLLTERLPHVKSASVGIWVKVGSRNERDEEAGVSHLIEHMIFKGTERRSALDIAKEIDQVGGMSNAFTSKEFTCFHAKVMADHLPMVTDLLTDIFLYSRFDSRDLERERQVVLQEIKMIEDTPDELAHVLFARNLWPDNSLGRAVMGSAETVGSVDREKVKEYLNRTYVPDRIVIAATGDVDHDRLVDLMSDGFKGLPPNHDDKPLRRPRTRPGVNIIAKDLEQVHICLGCEFPGIMDETRYTAALLNVLLGGNMSSRLFQEIREKRGLAYSVYSFYSAYLDSGMMGVYAGVDPGKTPETVKLIRAELDQLRQGAFRSEELKAAQEHLKGSIILGSESVDNRMTRLAKNEITYQRHIDFDEVLASIDRVTAEDLAQLADKYFQTENLSMTVLGPVDEQRAAAALRD
jgi:predicted Zn-dependent peptidase